MTHKTLRRKEEQDVMYRSIQLIGIICLLINTNNTVHAIDAGRDLTAPTPAKPAKLPVILPLLEEKLSSRESHLSGLAARYVMEALEKLYTQLEKSDQSHSQRLQQLRHLLSKSQNPQDSGCSLEALNEIEQLIRKQDDLAKSEPKSGDESDELEAKNDNVTNYLSFFLVNKGLRCNYDLELEVKRVKALQSVVFAEPQLSIGLRDFVANCEHCFQEKNKVPLLYFEINQRMIPDSCLIEGFAELLKTLDISVGTRISSPKIHAQLDQILAKLLLINEHFGHLRAEYVELISLVPELIEYTGHQTIGLLEASFISDKNHLSLIPTLKEKIVKKLKQSSSNLLDRIFN